MSCLSKIVYYLGHGLYSSMPGKCLVCFGDYFNPSKSSSCRLGYENRAVFRGVKMVPVEPGL